MLLSFSASERSLLIKNERSGRRSYSAIEADSVGGQDGGSVLLEDEPESIGKLLKKMSWRKRLTAVVASLVNFGSLACFAMMAPFLPLEAASKGIDGSAVGIIFASFELVMVVANILFGRFMSAIGARFMYISGIVIASICCILFGMLQWCPPGQVFFIMAVTCRVVEGIGTSMCQTASMTIVANEFPDRVATVMGLLETFAGLGLMVGPAIGGALYQLGGFYLPFVVMGVMFLSVGVLTWLILPESIIAAPKDRSALFRKFISIPTNYLCGICVAVSATVIAFLDPVFSKHLASIDETLATNGALMGLVFLVEPTLYAVLSPFIGLVADKAKYPLIFMCVGNVGFVIAYLIIGPCPIFGLPADAIWLPIFGFSLIGLFVAFNFMPAFAAMNKSCVERGLPNDIDLYGLIAGFFGTAFNFGAFCGPMIGGALGDRVGFAWATSIVALIPLVDAVVLAIASLVFYLPMMRS